MTCSEWNPKSNWHWCPKIVPQTKFFTFLPSQILYMNHTKREKELTSFSVISVFLHLPFSWVSFHLLLLPVSALQPNSFPEKREGEPLFLFTILPETVIISFLLENCLHPHQRNLSFCTISDGKFSYSKPSRTTRVFFQKVPKVWLSLLLPWFAMMRPGFLCRQLATALLLLHGRESGSANTNLFNWG